MKLKLLPILALVSLSVDALCENPSRVHVVPAGRDRSYDHYHYSPLVVLGDRILVSGIPASRGDTDEDKIRWAFQQLRDQLAAAGRSIEDVVEIQSFHVAADHEDFRTQMQTMMRVHNEFFVDQYPAWTAVGVTALLAPGAPVEIRAEAVVGSARRACVVRRTTPAALDAGGSPACLDPSKAGP